MAVIHRARASALVAGLVLVGALLPGSATVAEARTARTWATGTLRHRLLPPLRGGDQSWAVAVNSAGQVAGYSTTAGGAVHAVVWSGTRTIDLGTLGGASSRAVAINEAGMVTGDSTTASGATHAFVWSRGPMTDLGTLGGGESHAAAINAVGQVAGSSTTASGATRGFRWTAGRLSALAPLDGGDASNASGLNDLGVVTGSSTRQGSAHAVVWAHALPRDITPASAALNTTAGVVVNGTGSVLGNIRQTQVTQVGFVAEPDGTAQVLQDASGSMWALDMNAGGQVAGARNGSAWRAVVWSAGSMRDIGTLGGLESLATAIDGHGTVVGWSNVTLGSPERHAFVWSAGRLLDAAVTSRWSTAVDVDGAYVAGNATTPSGPSTAVLWWVS